jgi:ankyrin repeat protein
MWACVQGYGEIVRALLDSGADPTIADDCDATPMSVAKQIVDEEDEHDRVTAEGRRDCVAALEVRACL